MSAPPEVKLAAVPSAQKNVDLTRWRHDGTQTLDYADGNKAPNDGAFKMERELLTALAF